jgi:thiol:disulfide interchange protein
VGAVSKGAITTLLATPCSGPLLGSVFGFTLNQPPFVTFAIFTAIGLGMSGPYLLIGLFPGLVKMLPKPGAWMETFKQAMGFVLLGTVVFLFTFLRSDYLVPTFALLVGLWAACWWIGRVPFTATAGHKIRSWVGAGAFATAVGLAAFTYLVPGETIIPWKPFSRPVLAQYSAEGKTVMVDFTAKWCLTCKMNLRWAIDTRNVHEVIKANEVVPLLADWTDGSQEISDTLKALDSKSIPVLAIFPAGSTEPIILRDLLSESEVLEALKKAGPSKAKTPANTTVMMGEPPDRG